MSLARIWDHRLGLVVGPAGSGKTSLLTQFATTSAVPVAWSRADGHDASASRFVRCLERALCATLDGLPTGWRGVEDAADALAQWRGSRALLVVDDLHLLEGTDAEASLARQVDDAPPTLPFLVAGRRRPGSQPARAAGVGATCWRSGPTTCGSGRGRSSTSSSTSTGEDLTGGPRRLGPPHRGLGRRPAALPPGHRGQAGGAAADWLSGTSLRRPDS